MAGKLGSRQGTASLCKTRETLLREKTSDVEEGQMPAFYIKIGRDRIIQTLLTNNMGEKKQTEVDCVSDQTSRCVPL